MKKDYVYPTIRIIDLSTEGMIAESLCVSDEVGYQQLTNKQEMNQNDVWEDPEGSIWK